jgi:hypothetical protein
MVGISADAALRIGGCSKAKPLLMTANFRGSLCLNAATDGANKDASVVKTKRPASCIRPG